jgi:putative tricarboxylic transport membrane protein
MTVSSGRALNQTLVGAGALLVGAVMAYGASAIPAHAGYAGVGPNFLPWVVSVVLLRSRGSRLA